MKTHARPGAEGSLWAAFRARPAATRVDGQGRSHAFTGSRKRDWAGHRTGPGYAVQGNRLVCPETLAEIIRVFEDSRETRPSGAAGAGHRGRRGGRR
ncbi:DUF1028 domain-containing protein [Micromonospora purpureochromogenes]|uniref:DUF1028 domain-containing protein n=1 Tax=Micromonospora purpureochromogenes TaxID=47872 RepID=UPI0033FFA893